MEESMDNLVRLQDFFRELFQLDLADLDFGLYRLFHLKRAEIETFITEQLPREVDAAFAEVSAEDRTRLQEELKSLTTQIKEQIAEDAILPTGELKPEYLQSNIKVVRELAERYEEIRAQLKKLQVTEDQKAEVFNHLVNFFSRYYEDGDFIPKRRYGDQETYAVPYKGEEVFFYWANKDQHYVKTHERFRDYAFKLRDLSSEYRVRFIMIEASVPKDNTKGKRRYFFPRPDLATYNEEFREFVLPFEYRLPTPEEAERHGTNSKAQEAILEETISRILEAVSDQNLRALLQQDQRTGKDIAENKPELPLLLKRLRHFCKRNTSDYFIHKNLRDFLSRELEFYIKDQIIHLMDLEADLDAKRRVVRTFRKLAEKVIDFLATIEDAQKTLFEKKKFVLETDYLIPIQHVPREFWPDILRNKGQLEEWRRWLALEPEKTLFNPQGEVNEASLKAHPTLPVHTKHFDRDFVRRLLEALPFDDLDEATDGLLVHGENYQALRLLLERYREQVKCIYIDPPYNTGEDDFIYKDRYQHSSWLSLIEGRLTFTTKYLRKDGSLFVSIDDNEMHHLRILEQHLLGDEGFVASIVWQKRTSPDSRAPLGAAHDYILVFARSLEDFKSALRPLPLSEDRRKQYKNPDNDPRGPWASRDITAQVGHATPDQFYEIVTPAGVKYKPPKGRCWAISKQTFDRLVAEGRIWFGMKGRSRPRLKIFLSESEGVTAWTWWTNKEVGHNQEATKELNSLLGSGHGFETPKPIRLLKRILELVTYPQREELVLDFFAGSGTTGHAVINLNREDGGRRKFILVEMGEYFDTVLLPRIAKVMYTPEWKDGKPKRQATPEEAERTPRLVKILRIESYEDALHNLAAPSTLERAAEHAEAYKALAGEDTYRLRYWIELPLREAETCLRTFDLAHPFAYSIEVLTDDGPARKSVDVVETFNYLYGLRVRRYETWHNPQDGDREYRVVKATDREGKRRILVIWRDMRTGEAPLRPETERAFLEEQIAAMQEKGEVWDEKLINGDSPTPGVASLDPLFKQLMMQGEEK